MNWKRITFVTAVAVAAGLIGMGQAQQKPKRYVLTLELAQSHFTLNLETHLKDALNKATFDIPVDKEFYDQVKVGSELVDEFRTGSFLLYGSFGDWHVTVKNKMEK